MKMLLGIVSLLMGVVLVGWILFNFVHPQPEANGRNPIGPMGIGILLIYCGVMWIQGKTVK